MKPHLTKNEITSFLGHVVPIGMVASEDLTNADISWSVEGDAVTMRCFDKTEYGTKRGVLLTLVKLGEAKVHAEYLGNTYTATVVVRPMRKADPEAKMSYYIGDLHNHMSMIHERNAYAARTGERQIDYIKQVSEENLIDFSVMTDHGDVVTERDFVGQFLDYDAYEPKSVVILPGSESEATVIEPDRLGVMHHNSGEVVMLNANNFSATRTWQDFFDDFRDTPLPIGTFAHPQVMGGGNHGLWNPRPDINSNADLKRLIKLVEMGDGSRRSENLIHEYTYSTALDYGFRLSPTCSSDSHGPVWGFAACPGKTVIMAPEKSAEAFIDAMNEGRVYATESGNVKLEYTVNGKHAPADISPDVTEYSFKVSLDYFRDDPTTHPVAFEVISDFGKVVYSAELEGDNAEFTLHSESARYFYLRLWDAYGRRTWSAPTYLGRAPEVYNGEELKPLRKYHMSVYDEISLENAGAVFTEDLTKVWQSPNETCSLFIDFCFAHKVCALGHTTEVFNRDEIKEKHMMAGMNYAPYPAEFRISGSIDGVHFTTMAEGTFRNFGGEEIIRFEERVVRFVRFEVLSTVGKRSKQAVFLGAKPRIGELTLFSR